jgi:hypothetical protein
MASHANDNGDVILDQRPPLPLETKVYTHAQQYTT